MRATRSSCPIAATLDIVGDRWSLVVLRDILMRGKRRYRDLAEGPEAIATNVLAERLARLEDYGIITKTRDPKDRRQFIYEPTDAGLDFVPILFQLIRWGLKHVEGTRVPVPRERLADPDALDRAIRARFARPASARAVKRGVRSAAARR